MDGMPNTPNTPNDTPGATARCPSCGALVLAAARFCGACGAEVIARPAAPVAPSDAPQPAAPTQAAASGAPVADPAPSPIAPGEGKVCNWCGAVSARDAETCASCGASFPTREGDEAMERAAKARIDDMQADIQKSKSGGWWPFRSR